MSDNAVSKPTSGKAWRKLREEGVAVTLPSGFTAMLRPISMEWLYKTGKIPDSLTTIVANIIKSGDYKMENILEAAHAIVDLKILMCKGSFVNPKIVDDPKEENEIAYEDLSSDDSEFVLDWAQRPQKDLANFRSEQELNVELARYIDNVQLPAESVPEN